MTPVYRASMGVVAPQGLEPEFGGNVEPFTLTMSNLVRSNIVAETVIRNLGLEDSTQALLRDVRVQSKPSTAALEVSYDSTNKQKAVAVLSEIGTVFAQLVDQKLRTTVRQPGGGTANGAVLTANVFDPAHLEPGRVSPKLSRNLAFAGALGLALGLVLAFVREALDDRVRRRKDATEWLGAPVIGSLPGGQRGRPLAASLSGRGWRERFEALQLLRAKLQFASSAVSGPVLVVTSGQEGEGKSIAVASLGLALSAAGKDVICVDADLYRPRLHEYLGLPANYPGFAELLNEQAELDDVLQDISLGPMAVGGDGSGGRGRLMGKPQADSDGESLAALSSAWGSLQAVTAGRQDATPEPFDERRLARLLGELRNRADYVVFDTPPVLLVGDAFPLLIAADSVIAVARLGWTRKGAAEAVRVTLDGLGIDRLSVILTDSDEREAFRYGGGYYRRQSARQAPEESGVV
jgi:Mrp family chromosome partitioning ATPase/capsular polysaccharide biosynthesis protein